MKIFLLLFLTVVFALTIFLESYASNKVVVVPLKSSLSSSQTIIRKYISNGNAESWSVSGLKMSSCLNGETLTGGSCSASSTRHDSSITNWGVLWICDIVGNSIIGASVADHLGDNRKYGPPITVNAVCTSTNSMSTREATKHSSQEGANEQIQPEVQAAMMALTEQLETKKRQIEGGSGDTSVGEPGK